ncbi:MAG: HPr family phosphocarrier protein [Anaerolineales bacterium]|nr:HPr family phosphocarrier protein [Anaerolineales bacterium]
MKSVELTVTNAVGLHARPATLFVKAAQKHAAEISVTYGDKTVSAKSLLALLTLAAGQGAVITVSAEGEGAEAALSELQALVESDFGE